MNCDCGNNCNCCDFENNPDYNRFGDVGYYMPLAYQIYYNSKKGSSSNKNEDLVLVEDETLVFSCKFKTAVVRNEMLILTNKGVSVSDDVLDINVY